MLAIYELFVPLSVQHKKKNVSFGWHVSTETLFQTCHSWVMAFEYTSTHIRNIFTDGQKLRKFTDGYCSTEKIIKGTQDYNTHTKSNDVIYIWYGAVANQIALQCSRIRYEDTDFNLLLKYINVLLHFLTTVKIISSLSNLHTESRYSSKYLIPHHECLSHKHSNPRIIMLDAKNII